MLVVAAVAAVLSAMGATAEARTVPLAPVAVTCGEGLSNGSFEEDAAWVLPGTAYPAAYSTAMAHSDMRSLRAGILMTDANVYKLLGGEPGDCVPYGGAD